MNRLFLAAALVAAAPALAQTGSRSVADQGDPFAGMTPAGHAKAQALNDKIRLASEAGAERNRAARMALQEAARAEPADMAKVREAARKYEEGLAELGDFTVEWVDLAASLEPGDRSIILRQLPKIGGVMHAPISPPPPPRRPGL